MRKYRWLPVWRNQISRTFKQQHGISLLELLFWVMLSAFLLAPAASLLGWAVNLYDRCLAGMVLQQEMRFALCSIENDVHAAKRFFVRQDGAALELYQGDPTMGTEQRVYYTLRANRITKDTQPVTGDSNPYRIEISLLTFEQISEQAVRMKLEAHVRGMDLHFIRSMVLSSDFT